LLAPKHNPYPAKNTGKTPSISIVFFAVVILNAAKDLARLLVSYAEDHGAN